MSPTSAVAQDTSLRSLNTWGLSRGWEGVGLLNIGGHSTCTGVLIEPDLVLTAAHCLVDVKTGKKRDPRSIEFRAGWRNGKAIADRYGRAAVIHPDFAAASHVKLDNIRSDVALLQLVAPIQATHANPFRADGGINSGHDVSVVSYGNGRNDAPSRQRSCKVLEAEGGIVAMSCDAVPGSSGAPVFAMRQGRPRIVSLVSALGTINGKPVSFGMDIQKPLAKVMAEYKSGEGVFPSASNGAKTIAIGAGSKSDGARFLKP